jgi:hypothetical protein
MLAVIFSHAPPGRRLVIKIPHLGRDTSLSEVNEGTKKHLTLLRITVNQKSFITYFLLFENLIFWIGSKIFDSFWPCGIFGGASKCITKGLIFFTMYKSL